mmetsp:Transcript_989/g.1568  ORF Transcript_989/g.1568 Transcript_989/m.1568 type:complete len:257 (-) Transcript_989:2027-2797(-)
MTPSRSVPLSPRVQVALGCPFTTFAPLAATSVAPTASPTVLCPCCASSMTLPDMWIRVVASARAPLPSTWSLGTQTCLTGLTCARTMERRRDVPVTCSMACGSTICSCSEWRPTKTGACSAPTRHPAWPTAGERSSMSCTHGTSVRAVPSVQSVLSSCGLQCWRLRSRLATLTSCTRTPATARATSRTWGPSSAVTCVLRSLSSPVLRRQPCATWPALLCPASCASGEQSASGRARSLSGPWMRPTGTLTLTSLLR